MEAAFEKHLEEEASRPKVEEKRLSKEEILKRDYDRKKTFMEYALQKYNDEEDLAGVCAYLSFHFAIYYLDHINSRVIII
jgi:hypothetical protein